MMILIGYWISFLALAFVGLWQVCFAVKDRNTAIIWLFAGLALLFTLLVPTPFAKA